MRIKPLNAVTGIKNMKKMRQLHLEDWEIVATELKNELDKENAKNSIDEEVRKIMKELIESEE